jgi:predicted transcriptional regulator
MPKKKKITPVEWEIMESVWQLGDKTTAREVHEHAFPNGEKAITTIQTILNNLHKKGYLYREKIGLVNFYSPTRNRRSMLKEELFSTASILFNGSVPDMANFLIENSNLGLEEIQQIKEFLATKEKEFKDESS